MAGKEALAQTGTLCNMIGYTVLMVRAHQLDFCDLVILKTTLIHF